MLSCCMGTCEDVDAQSAGLGARLTSRIRGGAPEGKHMVPEDTAGIQEHGRSLGAQFHVVRPKPHLSCVGLAVKDCPERVDTFCREEGWSLGECEKHAQQLTLWPGRGATSM